MRHGHWCRWSNLVRWWCARFYLKWEFCFFIQPVAAKQRNSETAKICCWCWHGCISFDRFELCSLPVRILCQNVKRVHSRFSPGNHRLVRIVAILYVEKKKVPVGSALALAVRNCLRMRSNKTDRRNGTGRSSHKSFFKDNEQGLCCFLLHHRHCRHDTRRRRLLQRQDRRYYFTGVQRKTSNCKCRRCWLMQPLASDWIEMSLTLKTISFSYHPTEWVANRPITT